jgi:AraC-like DNA-binding protein
VEASNAVTESTLTPARKTLVAASGDDTDAAIGFLAGHYAGRSWGADPVGERFWFKYVGVGDDQLSVRRSQLHGAVRGDVATESEVVVQWLDRGEATIDVGGNAIRMRPGVPVLFPIDRRFQVEAREWDQRLVHVRRDLVLEVASEQNLFAESLAFDNQVEPTAASVTQWRTAVAGAVRALQSPSGGASSLLWHEAQRDVARALLHLYPLHAGVLSADHAERSTARLRAAVDHIHAHAHEPVSASDIAAAAGLSIRWVQEAFQRVLGQSPLNYLRGVRLVRVHEQLRMSDPGTTRVRDVAETWGFAHMGRFAGAYFERFGEYPRETLRRS